MKSFKKWIDVAWDLLLFMSLKAISYNDVVRAQSFHSSNAVPTTVFCPNVPTPYDQIYNATRKRTCYR